MEDHNGVAHSRLPWQTGLRKRKCATQQVEHALKGRKAKSQARADSPKRSITTFHFWSSAAVIQAHGASSALEASFCHNNLHKIRVRARYRTYALPSLAPPTSQSAARRTRRYPVLSPVGTRRLVAQSPSLPHPRDPRPISNRWHRD